MQVEVAPVPGRIGGGVFVAVGIPLLIFGILALVAAAVVAQGTASFNQACAQNSLCTPEPDPSGGIAAAGVLLLVIAIVLIAYGASRGRPVVRDNGLG